MKPSIALLGSRRDQRIDGLGRALIESVLGEEAAKGDRAGHAFRGNQYVEGEGESGGDAVPLLHGTSERRLKQILREGLRVSRAKTRREWDERYYQGERGEQIFVTDSRRSATFWAEEASEGKGRWVGESREWSWLKGRRPVILEIRLPASEAAKLVPDENAKSGRDFGFQGDIRPEWITGARVADNDGGWGEFKIPRRRTRKADDALVTLYVAILLPAEAGEATKGDVDGHPFRGNQYTGGIDGGGEAEPERSLANWTIPYSDKDPLGMLDAAQRYATRLGFDSERVTVDSEPKRFTLNGKEYRAAGLYHPSTDSITIYDHVQASYLPEVMAHEVGHSDFESAWAAVQDEEAGRAWAVDHDQSFWTKEARWNAPAELRSPENEEKLAEWVDTHAMMHLDGSLTTAGRNKYPILAAMQNDGLTGTGAVDALDYVSLAREDGVTDYSREWWEARARSEASVKSAMHETFAEINMRVLKGEKLEDVAKPKWQKLYRLFRKLAETGAP